MLAFINGLSPMHLLVVLVIALLLFGNRLPEVMRSIGRSINEFKKGMSENTDDNAAAKRPADQPPLQRLSPPNEAAPRNATRTSSTESVEQ